jgi:tetratricopeptide (TPR) repeat protein
LLTGYTARLIAELYRKRGDLEAAQTNLRVAWGAHDELHRQHPRVTDYTRDLAFVYEDIASVAEKQNNPLDALKAQLLAEALTKELVARDGESHTNRASLARVEGRLAKLYQDLGALESTRRAFELAKAQLEYLLEHNSPRSFVRADLAATCHQLGVTCAKLNRYKDAAANAEAAEKHYRVLLDRAPNDGLVRKNLGAVLGNRAVAYRALNRFPDALDATEERVRLWPNGPVELYDAAADFARTFEQASRVKEPSAPVRDRALKNAIDTLRRAVRAGFADHEKIRTDARFAPIRETPEFQALLKELTSARP